MWPTSACERQRASPQVLIRKLTGQVGNLAKTTCPVIRLIGTYDYHPQAHLVLSVLPVDVCGSSPQNSKRFHLGEIPWRHFAMTFRFVLTPLTVVPAVVGLLIAGVPSARAQQKPADIPASISTPDK